MPNLSINRTNEGVRLLRTFACTVPPLFAAYLQRYAIVTRRNQACECGHREDSDEYFFLLAPKKFGAAHSEMREGPRNGQGHRANSRPTFYLFDSTQPRSKADPPSSQILLVETGSGCAHRRKINSRSTVFPTGNPYSPTFLNPYLS
jgi:hypothetical protein